MKKAIVISLGGSLIVPDKMNFKFLDGFKKTLEKNYKTHKFAIVCGGGTIARKYISALKKEGISQRSLSLAGIRATRMNARFMMQFFGKKANDTLPLSMKQVNSQLKQNQVVFCGALRFSEKSTSDTTAAKLANYLKTQFINITNVKGLYTADPRKRKNAKFISQVSWTDFESLALKIKHKPGQHFVLDQKAATLIRKNRTKTYIINENLSNLSNTLKNKKFIGTQIEG
jgi:uridylate kinase